MRRCFFGALGHFIFFGLLVGLMFPGYIGYFLFQYFIQKPRDFFQKGASLSYKIFYAITPKIVLKKELLPTIPQGVIFISTHQSILDFPALTTFIEKYLIFANVNLGKYKLVEKITHSVGVRYIKGKNIEELGAIHKEIEEQLDKGENVIYFPEGSRHNGKTLLPFKRGAFKMAKKKNKLIVPIVIEGAYKLLPKNTFCFVSDKKITIYLTMLQPLDPNDFESELEMMHHAQKIMQKEKEELCELS
jgi:1-acyl-sn-glycerol-3-phosphate acyltransferase